jgi:hypothetical protein
LGLDVRIERDAGPGLVPFMEVFKGFERVSAVKAIFGDGAEDALG